MSWTNEMSRELCEKLTMALAGDFGANASRKVSLARYWANFLARNSIYCYSFARPSRRVSLCNVVRSHYCHSFPCQRYCRCHHHCRHLRQHCSSTTTMSTVALLPTAFVVAAVTCCSSQLSFFSLAHCSTVARVWSHSSPDWWSECTPSSSTRDGCPWTRCWAHQSRLKCAIRKEEVNGFGDEEKKKRKKDWWRNHMAKIGKMCCYSPKWGSVTVMVLLEPVSKVASLCTSTLAGLKSSAAWEREMRNFSRWWRRKKVMDVASSPMFLLKILIAKGATHISTSERQFGHWD